MTASARMNRFSRTGPAAVTPVPMRLASGVTLRRCGLREQAILRCRETVASITAPSRRMMARAELALVRSQSACRMIKGKGMAVLIKGRSLTRRCVRKPRESARWGKGAVPFPHCCCSFKRVSRGPLSRGTGARWLRGVGASWSKEKRFGIGRRFRLGLPLLLLIVKERTSILAFRESCQKGEAS